MRNRSLIWSGAIVAMAGTIALVVTLAGNGEPSGGAGLSGPAQDSSFDSSVKGSKDPDDVAFMDAYAEELGIVMSRVRGVYGGKQDAEAFARRVDGPGPDIETLDAAGSLTDGDGATVVLRLRRERQRRTDWLGAETTSYEISACYRWVFGGTDGDRGPERLDECPDRPVIELGPPPVEPELPTDIVERLQHGLEPLAAETVTEDAVMESVRSIYTAAVHEALDRPGAEPGELLREDEAMAGDDRVATADDGAIGVAVGSRGECVLARLVPGNVSVWRPPQISQAPGEIGCSASWAARGGEL